VEKTLTFSPQSKFILNLEYTLYTSVKGHLGYRLP
jgi:hypothetical protein